MHPYYTVKAWGSWAQVERGELAHYHRHDSREAAMLERDALPFPIVDVIRHDDTGGRVISDRVDVRHPLDSRGRPTTCTGCDAVA